MRLIGCPYCGTLHDLDRIPDVDHVLQARGKFCPSTHQPLDAAAAASYPIVGRAIERDAVRADLVAQVAEIAAQQRDDTVMRSIVSQRSDRFYAFSSVPRVSRNTFTGGAVPALMGYGPGLAFTSVTVPEDNKLCELQLEGMDGDIPIDGCTNKPYLVEGYQWGSPHSGLDEPGDTAFVGIEIGTHGTNTFGASPINPVCQLRQRLNTVRGVTGATTWELLCAKGDGSASLIVVVPNVPAGESLGHKVALRYDPVARTVEGLVDGNVIAMIDDPDHVPDPDGFSTVLAGLFVTSGVATGAGAGVTGNWCAFHCNYVGAYVGP